MLSSYLFIPPPKNLQTHIFNVVITAEFVVQDEDAVAIFEALCILREWNPEWKPLLVMTDFDYKEINAIESG